MRLEPLVYAMWFCYTPWCRVEVGHDRRRVCQTVAFTIAETASTSMSNDAVVLCEVNLFDRHIGRPAETLICLTRRLLVPCTQLFAR